LIAATPAIRAIREYYPEAFITLLANKQMSEICPPGTVVDEVILYDVKAKSLKEHVRMIRELSRRRFDIAVNLRWQSEYAAIITWLSGARWRVGSGPKTMRWIYNIKAPWYEGRRHEFQRYLDIVHALGLPVQEPKLYVHSTEADEQVADAFVKGHGCTKSTTLVIHPGASSYSKAWMPERFSEIGKRFVERFKGQVIVAWGPGEETLATQITQAIGANAHKSPPPTVGLVAAIMARCGLCLCNFSASMNIAMAVETPVVAIGCTSPEDWGPYGPLHRLVYFGKENDNYTEAESYALMQQISVERVWDVVQRRWLELSSKD
jgi:ADP-heptose:LPS heptosyltransferase